MRTCFVCLLIFLLSSCRQSAIKQSFAAADSLVVHFKDEQAGTITKTVQTAESKAISRIIEFIDAKETEQYKCGYDGKMFFYSKPVSPIKVLMPGDTDPAITNSAAWFIAW